MALPKLTFSQWIRVFALVPASLSLAVTLICCALLFVFWTAYSGSIVIMAAFILLFLGGAVFMRSLLR
jgi:Flp pilus assembly protein TadB